MEDAAGIGDIVSFYITVANYMGRNLTFISPPSNSLSIRPSLGARGEEIFVVHPRPRAHPLTP